MTPDTAEIRRKLADPALPRVDPAAVRALCDAADEVERLRCAHCGEVGCDWIGDIRKARAEAAEAALLDARAEVERLRQVADEAQREAEVCADERDASRTAHAALDADLRAKVAEARTWRGYKTRDIGDAFDAVTVTDLLDDLDALLDRHAPEETT